MFIWSLIRSYTVRSAPNGEPLTRFLSCRVGLTSYGVPTPLLPVLKYLSSRGVRSASETKGVKNGFRKITRTPGIDELSTGDMVVLGENSLASVIPAAIHVSLCHSSQRSGEILEINANKRVELSDTSCRNGFDFDNVRSAAFDRIVFLVLPETATGYLEKSTDADVRR